MDEILNDDRFKHIAKDHRFKMMHKNERKFKVDKRFKNMFHDKKFKLKYTVDKRGRPVNTSTNDNLKKYYQLPSSSSSSEDEEDEEEANDEKEKAAKTSKKKEDKKKVNEEKKKEEETDEDDEDENEDESEKNESENEEEEKKSSSEEESSEDEDDDDSSDDQEEATEIPWNELDRDTIREEKTSSRLAICNMDWDRIKASDLYMLFNSFKPAQGVIKSIKIYLSEYGKERLEYEKLHGPKELTEGASTSLNNNGTTNDNKSSLDDQGSSSSSEDERDNGFDDDDDDDDLDRHKLRIYQFNRLRYYYAVLECDNAQTAEKIYAECDGMEYESSCNRIDLRFIPDEMEFDDERDHLREACTEAPDPITFKPNLYFTTALNQTKVECTWDETPRDRLALTMRKFTEDDLKTSDFRGILATSSEEEDNEDEEEQAKKEREKEKRKEDEEAKKSSTNEPETEEDRIRRYRELLLGAGNKSKSKNREGDLQFDWEGGDMKEDGFNELLFNNQKKKPNKKYGKQNAEAKRELTEEEKKEQAQLSMLTMDDEDNRAHFNLDDLLIDKKGKTKPGRGKKSRQGDDDESKRKNEDDFKLNLEDPRFQAIFTSHKFNIDPSDQSFKKTAAMEKLLDEKVKRLETLNNNESGNSNKEGDDSKTNGGSGANKSDESLLVVRSIKSKTEVLKRKREESQQKLQKFKAKKF